MEYRTIADFATDEFVEKKSRFIGYIAPARSEEEAVAFINRIREMHREATHNVYAYILREGQTRRYSDDGEPQGTAGIPVLDVLQKAGLVDVVAVVTRYFGGTLLGAGGLVRAYTAGARMAMEAGRIRTMSPCTVLELDIDYGLYGKLSYILPKYEIVTRSADFGVAVRMQLLMKDCYLEGFKRELQEITSATVFPYEVEHCYADLAEG